tara:strand:- start:57 stop:431 length:375 start_codon:yes stop_codon:yes gene_type:complete
MKKIFFLVALFSSLSVAADWKFVALDSDGNSQYIDTEKIRKHRGYAYYWSLIDMVKPSEKGDLSIVVYVKVDCESSMERNLLFKFHTKKMGEGAISSEFNSDNDWRYPSPGSIQEENLNFVCSQ